VENDEKSTVESTTSEGQNPKSGKVPAKEKIAYGLGSWNDMWGNWLYMGVIWPVFNGFLHVGPALIGLVLMVNRLIDAVSDPFFGNLSDNTRTKWGRRRPFILVGAIVAGLFFPINFLVGYQWSEMQFVWYMIGSTAIFITLVSAFNMPYQALGSELTPDYNERTSIYSYRSFIQKIGEIANLGAAAFITMSIFNVPFNPINGDVALAPVESPTGTDTIIISTTDGIETAYDTTFVSFNNALESWTDTVIVSSTDGADTIYDTSFVDFNNAHELIYSQLHGIPTEDVDSTAGNVDLTPVTSLSGTDMETVSATDGIDTAYDSSVVSDNNAPEIAFSIKGTYAVDMWEIKVSLPARPSEDDSEVEDHSEVEEVEEVATTTIIDTTTLPAASRSVDDGIIVWAIEGTTFEYPEGSKLTFDGSIGSGTVVSITEKPNMLQGMRVYALIIGLAMALVGIIVFFFVKERYYEKVSEQEKVSLADSLWKTLKVRPFLIMLITALSYGLGASVVGTLGYYVTVHYVCAGDWALGSKWTFAMGVGGVIFVSLGIPLFAKISSKISKRNTMILVQLIGILAFAATWVLYSPETPWLQIVAAGLIFVTQASFWMLYGSMGADVVDYDELHSGKRREGSFTSCGSWIIKVGLALGMALSGWVLEWTGFDSHLSSQTPEVLTNMRLALMLIPITGLAISIIALIRFSLTPEKMEEVRNKLEAKRGEI